MHKGELILRHVILKPVVKFGGFPVVIHLYKLERSLSVKIPATLKNRLLKKDFNQIKPKKWADCLAQVNSRVRRNV